MFTKRVTNATGLSSGLKTTITALSLFGLVLSASAQNPATPEMAREKGFTFPAHATTPMVLETQPDAACDLHAEGVTNPAQTMRLYANAEGYIRVHVSPKYDSQTDTRVQLDCTSGGKVTRYPLHLRTGVDPTGDMPAPQASIPEPKGSRMLPALTGETAKLLSDEDLFKQGYPRRPDAVTSPDQYQHWLQVVSRPITVVPAHTVSRSDISHRPRNVQAGPQAGPQLVNNGNWSGFELQRADRTFLGVQGQWNVPAIIRGEPGYTTSSSFWVGLDGDGLNDLVQAGTEQDYIDMGGVSMASYHVWTEVLPNQPTEQEVTSIDVSAGHDMVVAVSVNSGVARFSLVDRTTGQSTNVDFPLGSTYYVGSEAEWIMERPAFNCAVKCVYSELSEYSIATMVYADAFTAKGIVSSITANVQLNMYNQDYNHPDNNLLSWALLGPSDSIVFNWVNFH